MYCIEYGKENKDVIFLLHGGGLSWWNYKEVSMYLAKQFHVVLPILDGHAKSEHNFTTIERNANRIIDYINTHFGGSIKLLGGVSLGAQIALEILSKQKDICSYAVIESALVLPSKMTSALVEPAFGSSYGLISQRWFAKLQFSYLKIKEDLFEDYYRDTCAISRENMIAFLKENSMYKIKETLKITNAKMYIYVGEKENKKMLESAKLIHHTVIGSTLKVLENLYHGEFSINHAQEYAQEIQNIIKGPLN